MKTIIKSTLLIIAVMLGLSFSSCNDNSDPVDSKTEQEFYSCYAVVSDLQDAGSMNICTPVVIKLYLNWTKGNASMDITGLSLGGKTCPKISMTDIPWGSSEGVWGEAYSKNPTMVTSSTGITPSVEDLRLRWVDRMDFIPVAGKYDPGCVFSFVIDGRYSVIGSRQPFLFAGSTKTTDQSGNVYETLKPVYAIGLDFTNNVADIVIKNAQFQEGMPHLTMRFSSIPFTIKDGGTRIELAKESLIPSIGDAPQSSYPISDLQATITPGSGMSISFKCDFRNQAVYNVNANVDYTSYGEVLKDY